MSVKYIECVQGIFAFVFLITDNKKLCKLGLELQCKQFKGNHKVIIQCKQTTTVRKQS